MSRIKEKNYECQACGYTMLINTNHYGPCYSFGTYNRCPDCGPTAPDPARPQAVEYPITVWICKEAE